MRHQRARVRFAHLCTKVQADRLKEAPERYPIHPVRAGGERVSLGSGTAGGGRNLTFGQIFNGRNYDFLCTISRTGATTERRDVESDWERPLAGGVSGSRMRQ